MTSWVPIKQLVFHNQLGEQKMKNEERLAILGDLSSEKSINDTTVSCLQVILEIYGNLGREFHFLNSLMCHTLDDINHSSIWRMQWQRLKWFDKSQLEHAAITIHALKFISAGVSDERVLFAESPEIVLLKLECFCCTRFKVSSMFPSKHTTQIGKLAWVICHRHPQFSTDL